MANPRYKLASNASQLYYFQTCRKKLGQIPINLENKLQITGNFRISINDTADIATSMTECFNLSNLEYFEICRVIY